MIAHRKSIFNAPQKLGIAFFRFLCIILLADSISYPGIAQLVGRHIWELEHQNGSTAPNVAYSLLSSQIPLITSVESWAKLWYNFFDHIFDHNWNKNIFDGHFKSE